MRAYARAKGEEVRFQVGTDEHGNKVFSTAEKNDISVEEYAKQNSDKFRHFIELLKFLIPTLFAQPAQSIFVVVKRFGSAFPITFMLLNMMAGTARVVNVSSRRRNTTRIWCLPRPPKSLMKNFPKKLPLSAYWRF